MAMAVADSALIWVGVEVGDDVGFGEEVAVGDGVGVGGPVTFTVYGSRSVTRLWFAVFAANVTVKVPGGRVRLAIH
jgi:hypothetical protein